MREMHREPEVPETRVPVEEFSNALQGLPQRNLFQFVL